jgi:dTDP-4-dehydrorhamnose 3,5-epimerase-like enzyme
MGWCRHVARQYIRLDDLANERGGNVAQATLKQATLKVVETSVADVLAIQPAIFGDVHGFFMEMFNTDRYAAAGLAATFVQDNLSRSPRGVLRGLHIQIRSRKESS